MAGSRHEAEDIGSCEVITQNKIDRMKSKQETKGMLQKQVRNERRIKETLTTHIEILKL